MDDRSNTIAGWVLAGGIVALGLSIVTGMYFHPEAPEKEGFAIVAEAAGEALRLCQSQRCLQPQISPRAKLCSRSARLAIILHKVAQTALVRICGQPWVSRTVMLLVLPIPML